MINYQRIFHKDNTNLVDLSVDLCDYNEGTRTINYVAAEDCLYVGTILPFSNRYFDVSTTNGVTCSVSISTWSGNSFEQGLDIIDETSVLGASFSKSGLIRFTPNKDRSWVREYESFSIPGLETTTIYNLYWTKITFDADVVFGLNYVGSKFSTDTELFSYYPDLNKSQLLAQYESGKTSWNQQHFMASNCIVAALNKRGIALSQDQIMAPDLFTEASIHKTAEIIFGAFGSGYTDHKVAAKEAYNDAMNVNFFNVDNNRDGRLNISETQTSARFFRR